MTLYPLIAIIVLVGAIFILIYFTGSSKLKKYKEKMDKAESIIEVNLDRKLEIVISLNTLIKKATGKKDYLKDYVAIKDMIITNIEKDFKLDEATKLINDLAMDFRELATDSEFNKKMQELRECNELLVSAKTLFNQNAVESNKLIKSFPYNIVASINKYHIRTFYSNNKTDDTESL